MVLMDGLKSLLIIKAYTLEGLGGSSMILLLLCLCEAESSSGGSVRYETQTLLSNTWTGRFQKVLEGSIWNVMESHGIPWNVMECSGTFHLTNAMLHISHAVLHSHSLLYIRAAVLALVDS